MNYPESVQFLYALGNEVKTIKLGLERIRTLLDALGNPQRAYKVVHVAGTNGKGSVCAMIDAGLQAAGIRTGLFTSPHLMEPTERIQIDGEPVSEAEFERAFNVIHETAEKLNLDVHPTYFETVTAMALWLFRERGVEMAVVEVGLGGRLDATNVVEPTLTVITPIDYDHQQYLGNTLTLIAGEKAGILKPGVPAVFSKQHPEAMAVLNARAAELGIPVTRAEEFAVTDLVMNERGAHFSGIECPLPGEHQVDNAVTAAQALIALGVSPTGIEDARWPGRIEHVTPNPDTILDGAHNPAGAKALATYLRRFYGTRKRWIIFGAMRDKDVKECADILFPVADELVFTAPKAPGNRAMPPEELQAMAGRGHIEPTVKEAYDWVLKQVTAGDAIIITGSLYLVGEARSLFLVTTLGRW
jgi:dihydrofolate synthase / folylpolyglutamate synthase